ncbi:MAG: phosphopantetheine-binding protein [Syntrophobacteraceae bacterium]
MTKRDFLLKFEELLEAEPLSLTGGEHLRQIKSWDSMTVLGFIALVDEYFEITVPPSAIAKCQRVDDLIILIGNNIDN